MLQDLGRSYELLSPKTAIISNQMIRGKGLEVSEPYEGRAGMEMISLNYPKSLNP
jgi:hypothetical protein